MALQLIFLLFKLHLVFSAPQLHEFTAINLHHSRSHSSMALPPSQSSSRVLASIAVPPSKSLPGTHMKKWTHDSVDSPISHHKHHQHSRRKSSKPTPANNHGGPWVFPSQPPFSSPKTWNLPAPAPSVPSDHLNVPSPSPRVLPLHSSKHMRNPSPSPVLAFPPTPPNKDCMTMTCSEPLTYTPSGSPCGCVWPLQVKLRLSIAIYKFFPLVSELANGIAASVSLNRNQVRIVGADAVNHQLHQTTVLINLVPKGVNFDDATAFLIYKKFWHKEIVTDASLFGAYEVLYVHYPGLPPSPPSSPSSISGMDDGPYPGYDYNGTIMKPLGVDVPMNEKQGSGERGSMIIMIVLSCITVFVLFIGAAWLYLLKCGSCIQQPEHINDDSIPSSSKPSGAVRSLTYGSMPGSRSMSFSSGTIIYTGSVRTFTLNEIEKATNNFDALRIIGEGGFGLVYKGILHDGRDVAVKILKRYDQHGGREFLAEIEMLSRLHHRNLVKLIGICMENQTRCLVYELIPNGSVEFHLHGADKKTSPLDWNARMKIALGAARGLAYLHEDSNPRVIHRDFKSSNILLEHDFTPKVADFGLARTALDERNKHISTHVMGTFGYLAPEYAMTGHLLVKSDVYSYGVVLLELLTGRKPVDLSQPPGQENLVSWVRPLLTSKEGLQTIIDPVIESNVSFEAVIKVAAITSMCVQPEVSQRPFMGEVVQALKLVCCEFDDTSIIRSRSFHEDSLLTDRYGKFSSISGEMMDFQILTKSKLLSPSSGKEFESFRRHSDSEPLTAEKKRKEWQKFP